MVLRTTRIGLHPRVVNSILLLHQFFVYLRAVLLAVLIIRVASVSILHVIVYGRYGRHHQGGYVAARILLRGITFVVLRGFPLDFWPRNLFSNVRYVTDNGGRSVGGGRWCVRCRLRRNITHTWSIQWYFQLFARIRVILAHCLFPMAQQGLQKAGRSWVILTDRLIVTWTRIHLLMRYWIRIAGERTLFDVRWLRPQLLSISVSEIHDIRHVHRIIVLKNTGIANTILQIALTGALEECRSRTRVRQLAKILVRAEDVRTHQTFTEE
jgi:hypothetical protein